MAADPLVGQQIGTESSLSSWAGPYVGDVLGKGKALAEMPYEAYMGPLTAGASDLQNKAFNLGSDMSTPKSWTDAGVQQKYMSPYITGALNPMMDEARRQAEISRVNNAGRLTKAGAYGGSRQAIMESEGIRGLEAQLANIYGTGMQRAYEQGMGQFNTEQQQGLNLMGGIADLGAVQRGIESEGIAADMKQFEQERDDPYKKLQFQQSLLQGMPLQTQSYSYAEPGILSNLLGGAGGILDLYDVLFGGGNAEAA